MARCQRLGTSTSTAYMKHGCRCPSCLAWQAQRHARQRGPRSAPRQREDVRQPSRRAQGTAAVEHVPAALVPPVPPRTVANSGPSNPPPVLAIAPARTAQVPSSGTRTWVPPALRSRMRAPKRAAVGVPPRPSLSGRRAQVARVLLPAPQDRTGVHAVGWGVEHTHWPAGTLRLACGHLARMKGRQPTGTATLCPVCSRWERAEAWAGW